MNSVTKQVYTMHMKGSRVYLYAIFGCVLIGLLGTPFTASSIPNWYAQLQKPPLTPPNWIFAPVWSVLYICMGISIASIATQKGSLVRDALIRIFFIQLLLNFLWSVIFFGVRSIEFGLLILLCLDSAVYYYIWKAFKIRWHTSLIMIPYAIWISFATYLNGALLLLNRP